MAAQSFSASSSVNNDRRTARLVALLVLALTLAVYQRVWHFGFVGWDDGIHTYRNPYLNPVTPGHLLHFWRTPYERLYIPLSYMAYAALTVAARLPSPILGPDGVVIQINPHVFHAASLALHLLNVLLVFTLLRCLVRHSWAAGAGALLFALHPLQVESVAWVSELRGLLAAALSLGALNLYLRHAAGEGARGTYALALAAYALALLAKPDAAVTPLLALILDCFLIRRPFAVAAKSLIPWVAIALPVMICTHQAQPFQMFPVPLWKRPFIAGDALAFYLAKLAAPVRLATIYDRRPEVVLHHAWGYLTWLLPAAVAFALWRGRRRYPILCVAGALFAMALLPVLGLVPFQYQNISTVADRYVYLAMLSPALALAWGMAQTRLPSAPLVCGFGLAVCAGLSTVQIGAWQDTPTLFARSLAVAPHSPVANNALGKSEYVEGRTADALRNFRAALAVNPRYGEALYNLATALQYTGDRRDALPAFNTLLRCYPDMPEAYTDRGEIYAQQGRLAAAQSDLRRALRLDPNQAQAEEDLAQVLTAEGHVADAVPEWRQAVRICPDDAVAHHALAVALAQTGQRAAAEAELRQVARVDAKLASLQRGTP